MLCRYPEIYAVLPTEDVNEGEEINGDHVGEIQDLHKGSGIETQSVEKHDVWIIYHLILTHT